MKFITLNSKIDIESFLDNYKFQFSDSLKTESNFSFLTVGRINNFYESNSSIRYLSAIIDDNMIKSLVIYEKTNINKEDVFREYNFNEYVKDCLNIDFNISSIDYFFVHSFNKDIIYLDKIESFEKGKGYGSHLINNLKSLDDVESICIESNKTSIGFYENNGFNLFALNNVNFPVFWWNEKFELKNNYEGGGI